MYIFFLSLYLISLVIPIGSVPQVTYNGNLITIQHHQYPITNILIDGKQTCIKVFKAPDDVHKIIPSLTYNPKEFPRYINLRDIKDIIIPYPYATWIYKNKTCGNKGKDRYLLIDVMWRNKKMKPTTFLVEPKKKLSGVFQKSSGTSDMPFSGIRGITINKVQRTEK